MDADFICNRLSILKRCLQRCQATPSQLTFPISIPTHSEEVAYWEKEIAYYTFLAKKANIILRWRS